jgi:redox-sensitive bicupin YhaK (pirin superfamily)
MITLRRAQERHHHQRGQHEVWQTFRAGEGPDPPEAGFGTLESLNEDCLPPGAVILCDPHREAEIITYVRDGAIAYQDTRGRSGVIHAGEFQRMTAERRVLHSETNASRTDWARVFQVWLRPSAPEPGRELDHEQRRFSAAQRRGGLCIVASHDARRGSLRIHQDALVYSAMLNPGQHVVHELLHGRGAWLQVIGGELTLGDVVLTAGDGVGISAERAVSLTAREEAEILLLDLAA